MRKHCGNCANYRKETNQFSEECGKCVSARLENGETTDPSRWREKPQTNADRIRAMSDEELAKEMLFFCPSDTVFKGEDTYEKPHYTGLDGNYYATSEEVISKNIEWLKQPAED